MSSSVLLPGTLFAGRYHVEKCIAEGGMGAVYEVLHAETGRKHALKVMHAHTLSSAELRDRFRREARVAANIQSEFIVDVFDAGVDPANNLPFLVMELLQGEELGRLLQARGRFSPAETVLFLGQVAMALDKTHRAMIVHRDLKPENLFLTQRDDGSPRVKVLDFGVAKIVAETSTNAAATRSLGTPLYMAPEQFLPGNKVSAATDLYALAMIAYVFLVGRTYWAEEATEAANVFSFALTANRGPQEPPCARALRAGVSLPPAFDAWFARAANIDPSMRFPHAGAMIRALAEALSVPSPFRAQGDPFAGSGANPVLGDPLAGSGANPVIGSPPAGANPAFGVPPPGPGANPVLGGPPSGAVPTPSATLAVTPGPTSGPPFRDSATHALSAARTAAVSGATPAPDAALAPPFDDSSAQTIARPAPRAPLGSAPSGFGPTPSGLGPTPSGFGPTPSGLGPSASLTASGFPTVVGTTGGLPGTEKPASPGTNKGLIIAAVASFLAVFLVVAFVLVPKGGAGSGSPGAGASGSAASAEPPSPAVSTASIPTVTPSAPAASADPSAEPPLPSASASASSAPTGKLPKPRGPKPPGTSVYIRD